MSRRHRTRVRCVACAALLFALASCADTANTADSADTADSAHAADTAESGSSVGQQRRMEDAAAAITAFLQGRGALDPTLVADSVVLHVSEEGGGGSATRSAAELAAPGAWTVSSNGATHSFVPSPTLTDMTMKAGAHFVCRETTVAARAPQLAAAPHVGVLLKGAGDSCLQTWNATFVFDTAGATPKLVAAVYDQWEW